MSLAGLLRRIVRRRPDGRPYRHLRPGGHYWLARAFTDHDGREHPAGQRWRFVTSAFLPYEDGLTLTFATERGEDRIVRLQHRPEAEGAVIDDLEVILVPCPPPIRTAFAGVDAITPDGIVAFDGLRHVAIAWADIRRVTASYGRQQYDMTRCLTLDHRRGRSLFVPEVEGVWQALLDGVEQRLPGALLREDWYRRLQADPEHAVRIWPT